jgi:hypothetical protein
MERSLTVAGVKVVVRRIATVHCARIDPLTEPQPEHPALGKPYCDDMSPGAMSLNPRERVATEALN